MLNMAFRCGESFRRRYVENEIIPPGIAAGRGTGLHYANKVNLRQKITSGIDLPIGDIKDAARDGFIKAFAEGVYIPKHLLPEKDKLINMGLEDSLRCAEVYLEKVAPEIQPRSVEESFKLDVGLALPISGTLDIEREAKVDDLKTAAKKWADGQIDKEIQPVMYSYSHEKVTGIRPHFKYHIMIARRGKEGNATSAGYDSQEKTCTDQDYSALFAKLHIFIDMLKKGVFTPANPTAWWCSSDWCGYHSTCPFLGNGKQLKWV
jgi:hypothetical protein